MRSHDHEELRCELLFRGRELDATGVKLFENRVHVATSAALVNGDQVLVRLRVGDGAPLQLEAHVVARRISSTAAAELVLGFVFGDDGERARVRELMDGGPGDGGPPPARILVVDDSAIVRDLLVFGARRDAVMRDTIVDVASDGEMAWTMVQRATYDAAVVDFYLPRLTGAELTQRIREAPELAGLPIVALSAGGEKARRACLAAGVSAFVEKPVAPRALFEMLRPMVRTAQAAGRS